MGWEVNATPRPLFPCERDTVPILQASRSVQTGLFPRSKILYEVWNFNSGNYLFTTDTK